MATDTLSPHQRFAGRRSPVAACRSQVATRRRGVSVVEVLVALMLVTIGLLGIAGSTALALRTTLESANRRGATHRVSSRFAQLAAEGCASARAGTDSDPQRQLTERWTVVSAGAHFALVRDSVHWMSPRGPRSFALTTAIAC